MPNNSTSNLTAALIQQSCSADKKENIIKTIELIRQAHLQGAELIVLQELHSTLYFCQTENVEKFDLAETIPGQSTEIFAGIAKELKIVLVTSLFEKRAPGLYHNTSVVFEKDGSIAGTYRKMHIPDDPGFYEKFYFTPGDQGSLNNPFAQGFEPIQTSVGKLGILICWDQWFPEAARLIALRGAEILIYPTAIGWNPEDSSEEKARQKEAWIISQRAHAIANGLPVVSINRVGHEVDESGISKGIDFWGNSFAAGSQGEILAQASENKEEILIVNIDKRRTEEVRRIWPFFRDRRIDQYDGLLNRWSE